MPWLSSLVECAICGHQWAAVRPEAAGDDLQCPSCGYHGEVTNIEPEDLTPDQHEGWNHTTDGDQADRIPPKENP